MSEKNPEDTLSWAAYHLFNIDFFEKWKSNQLTHDENVILLTITILHCQKILKSRSFFQVSLKRFDRKRARWFTNMLIELMKNKFKNWLDVNVYNTMPELKQNDFTIQHLHLYDC